MSRVLPILFNTEMVRAIGTVEECRDARKKQIAMKPVDATWFRRGPFCPSCGRKRDEFIDDYCRSCGQKLDWSEGEAPDSR